MIIWDASKPIVDWLKGLAEEMWDKSVPVSNSQQIKEKKQ